MKKISLYRIYKTDGTTGKVVGDNFNCYSIEKPWDNNNHDTSCIPEGEYICTWSQTHVTSPIEGWAYKVNNVKDRQGIFIHIANYPHELLGCIALGAQTVINSWGEPGVLCSRDAVQRLYDYMNKEDFVLSIVKDTSDI